MTVIKFQIEKNYRLAKFNRIGNSNPGCGITDVKRTTFSMFSMCVCNDILFSLQACWKGYKQRKMYKDRMNLLQKNVAAVVKVINP